MKVGSWRKAVGRLGLNRVCAFVFLLGLSCGVNAQKELSIAAIQGEKNASPHTGANVRVSGIVTARTKTGFFIQTPDDKTDGNTLSSEGIFVFTRIEPPSEAAVGNLVSITGEVEEFRRDSEPYTLTITEISMRRDRDEVRVISKSNALPAPIVLTLNDFKSNSIDQLEKYEGMRVRIDELTVTSPTDGRFDIANNASESDGSFYGVLKGLPRPFREPGLDIHEFVLSDNKERFQRDFPKLPVFDSNPEVIRFDSDEQSAARTIEAGGNSGGNGTRFSGGAINVPSQTEIKNLVGALHYSFGKYTVLTEPNGSPAISTSIKPVPLPVPTDRQFSVAGMNIENFFDDQDDPGIKEDVVTAEGFQKRLKKISLAIRDVMKMPDVIGIVEAENLQTLKRLAERINADAVAEGKPDPKYTAFLTEGNDGRGIDNGFLVKSSRVKVIDVKQFGKNDKYKHPNTREDVILNDRPPLVMRASIGTFEFTVVVNHLKSFLGYSDPKQQDNVRMKKKLQAEFLAKLVQELQKSRPDERIILLGDFNAYQFNDGVLNMIGTITGKPAAKTEVLNFSEDLVEPNLIDLVDVIDQKQRYSYAFNGNAQVLDHIIVSENLRKNVKGFGYARVNADYPEIYRNDDSRPERFSDHDPAVAYFYF